MAPPVWISDDPFSSDALSIPVDETMVNLLMRLARKHYIRVHLARTSYVSDTFRPQNVYATMVCLKELFDKRRDGTYQGDIISLQHGIDAFDAREISDRTVYDLVKPDNPEQYEIDESSEDDRGRGDGDIWDDDDVDDLMFGNDPLAQLFGSGFAQLG